MTDNKRLSPVSEVNKVEIHRLDVKVSSRFVNRQAKMSGGIRGKISKLSNASRQRLIFKARNRCEFKGFITFTYPDASYAESCPTDFMTDGSGVKYQFQKLRQWLTHKGYGALWFLEFQKRGAPHFHLFTNKPLREDHAAALRLYWYELVGSDCPHHLQRGVDVQMLRAKHSAGAYAAKYSSKSEQKEVPDRYDSVGRFWGMFNLDEPDIEKIWVSSMKEVYQLARIAKRAEKAHRRSVGVVKRKEKNHHSAIRYSVAPAVLAYLKSRYTVLGNPDEIHLLAHGLPSAASSPPLPEDTLRIHVLL